MVVQDTEVKVSVSCFSLPFAPTDLLLLLHFAYIHSPELCGSRAAASEQVAAKCFSQEHSEWMFFFFLHFKKIMNLLTTSIQPMTFFDHIVSSSIELM